MSELQKGSEPSPLTAEVIREQTGFELCYIFPDFALSGRVSPELHEQREYHATQLGEDNVVTSFYTDENSIVQLGLFIRRETPQE